MEVLADGITPLRIDLGVLLSIDALIRIAITFRVMADVELRFVTGGRIVLKTF